MTLRQDLFITDNICFEWNQFDRLYSCFFTNDVSIFIKPYSYNDYEWWVILGNACIDRGFANGKPELKSKLLALIIQYGVSPVED